MVEESNSMPPGTFAATNRLMEPEEPACVAGDAGTDTCPAPVVLASRRDVLRTA